MKEIFKCTIMLPVIITKCKLKLSYITTYKNINLEDRMKNYLNNHKLKLLKSSKEDNVPLTSR